MDYKKLAATILEKVGGEKNVLEVGHCATRLRFNLKDEKLADTAFLKKLAGVAGVVNSGGQYQVIIGNDVHNVHKELMEIGTFKKDDSVKEQNKGMVTKVLDTISGIFFPTIPALTGCGMLKAILALLVAFKWVAVNSETYQFINYIADTGFYFLPFLLAGTAAKKFKCNPYMAMMIGGVLLHPTFLSMVVAAQKAGTGLHFLGMPVKLANYGSSVIPIILMVWLLSYVEPFIDKLVPKLFRIFAAPVLTLMIVAPISLIAIAPFGMILGDGLAVGIDYLNASASWLVPFLVGAFTPLMVMTGMHYGLIPIGINLLATTGVDIVAGPGMMVSNVAQGAAALAVAIRTQNMDVKQLSTTAGLSAILGITEPVLYGINLRFKKPLIAAMIGGGVAGLFLGVFGVARYAQVAPGLLSLPSYIGPDGSFGRVMYASVGCVIAFVIAFIVSYILRIDDPVEDSNEAEDGAATKRTATAKNVIYSPIKGKAVELKQVSDAAFAEGILGKGVAIIPEEGVVYAPADGVITALYDSKHAIGITTKDGAEILIHIGIDTVKLAGRCFNVHVKQGQDVKKGDLLLDFDMKGIEKEGYKLITPIVITNTHEYAEVLGMTGKDVKVGDALLKLAR